MVDMLYSLALADWYRIHRRNVNYLTMVLGTEMLTTMSAGWETEPRVDAGCAAPQRRGHEPYFELPMASFGAASQERNILHSAGPPKYLTLC